MKNTLLLVALLSTLGLAACDRQPVVVTTPPTTVMVPGPAGPAGATGATGEQGYTGNTGSTGVQSETGKTGDVTNVIVIPAAATPTN